MSGIAKEQELEGKEDVNPSEIFRKRKQSSEAAKRHRQKKKRLEAALREEHDRLLRSQSRMINAIIHLKELCDENKVKIPELGLEEGDLNSAAGDPATTLVQTIGKKRKSGAGGGKGYDSKEISALESSIEETENKVVRRVRVLQEKIEELTKFLIR